MVSLWQERQLLAGHEKQRFPGQRLGRPEAVARLLALPQRDGRSAARLLQPPQARQAAATAVRARRLPSGGLLRATPGLRGPRRPARAGPGERGGVLLPDALQRSRRRRRRRAAHRQLRPPDAARLLLPNTADV